MAEEHKYSCRSVAEVKYGTVFLFNFGNIFAEAFEVELRGLLGKLFYFCILQVWRRKLRNVEHWLSIYISNIHRKYEYFENKHCIFWSKHGCFTASLDILNTKILTGLYWDYICNLYICSIGN